MVAVLHAEPIFRNTHVPLNIGHNEDIFYGESVDHDSENTGAKSCHLRLGCPLEAVDLGSSASQIPMVKTIEYSPDFSRDSGNVYTETLHFFKDRKTFVPFRTTIRSGLGSGLRFNHLPSLNAVRNDIVGISRGVSDPRTEFVTDILLTDEMFRRRDSTALKDWIRDDLTRTLADETTSVLTFSDDIMACRINKYIRQLHETSSELTLTSLRDIVATLSPKPTLVPSNFLSTEPLKYSLDDMRMSMVNNPYNFKSFGRIPIDRFDNIDYNPPSFKMLAELIDTIPLTDFNVDMVISQDNDVEFFHDNILTDRFNVFSDYEAGAYDPKTIFDHYVNGYTANEIIHQFIQHHSAMTDALRDTLEHSAVKIKLIKTITDEAAVFLYAGNSDSKEKPFCGVYFDLALQSLAPLSIIATPIAN
jgi:hypothetical protein